MKQMKLYIRYMLLSLLLSSFVVGTATTERVVVTSGRVVYDAFGRVIETYHPTVDGDTVTAFSNDVDAVPPTRTKYNVLDRPTEVTYPDGTKTTTSYHVEGRALVTRVTDALGHTSDTHVSARGRTLKSVRYNSAGVTNAITTQYAYDGLGRLVSVTDAEGNVTSSSKKIGTVLLM
jgi:YD repeat-containing protein